MLTRLFSKYKYNIDKFSLRTILKDGFSKDVIVLTFGSGISQIISIITLPFLTRLYGPDIFGIFGIFLSIVSIVAVIAGGRYELSIMLPEKDEDASRILLLSIILCIAVTIISTILIVSLSSDIIKLIGEPDINKWLIYIPAGIFFLTLYNIFNYWTNRKKKYNVLAISRFIRSFINSVIALLFGFIKSSPFGLIIGNIFGSGFSVLYLYLKNKEENPIGDRIDTKSIIQSAKEYSDFPLKSVPGSLLNILSGQLPLLLLAGLYDSTIVGFYTLTLRILSVPMTLIGRSVSQVFYQRSVEEHRSNNLYDLVKRTSTKLFIIIILPMVIFLIWGREIFILLFGEKWETAGEITQLFIPFYLIRFIFSSQSTLMMVLRKIGFEFKFNFLFLITQIVSLYLGYYLYDDYYFSFLFMSISGFFIFLFLGYWIFLNSKKTLTS